MPIAHDQSENKNRIAHLLLSFVFIASIRNLHVSKLGLASLVMMTSLGLKDISAQTQFYAEGKTNCDTILVRSGYDLTDTIAVLTEGNGIDNEKYVLDFTRDKTQFFALAYGKNTNLVFATGQTPKWYNDNGSDADSINYNIMIDTTTSQTIYGPTNADTIIVMKTEADFNIILDTLAILTEGNGINSNSYSYTHEEETLEMNFRVTSTNENLQKIKGMKLSYEMRGPPWPPLNPGSDHFFWKANIDTLASDYKTFILSGDAIGVDNIAIIDTLANDTLAKLSQGNGIANNKFATNFTRVKKNLCAKAIATNNNNESIETICWNNNLDTVSLTHDFALDTITPTYTKVVQGTINNGTILIVNKENLVDTLAFLTQGNGITGKQFYKEIQTKNKDLCMQITGDYDPIETIIKLSCADTTTIYFLLSNKAISGETNADTVKISNSDTTATLTKDNGIITTPSGKQYYQFQYPADNDTIETNIQAIKQSQKKDTTIQWNNNMEIDLFIDTNIVTNGSLSREQESVKIYPNPFGNNIKINNYEGTATLYNMAGQKIIQTKENTIPTNNLPKGPYILELRNEEGIVRKKLIK